ncbi:hypothetical protein [Lysinibacillus sp. SGAir0095]|uniref:hypothetical protein n=1 Tax=Lysinibacillus sp. SGAir0095 TaxID=2070463 RepID=UPI0010CCC750|nr:hypothetical protein [Lysinibacillus sp. SGAir0095]QCR32339.1 hypothetical protein C1N55_09195 [Lysinibacillus sp. SGAir0095]
MNITGLSNRKLVIQPMDGQLFRRLGYEIARKVNGKVLEWLPPRYPLNYFRLVLLIDGKIVSILLHEYFPYAAIVSYKDELQMNFYDYEEVEFELAPYYTVLKAAFLNEPFNPKAHDLSEIELRNVKHWRPKNNGEVIFNCWD